MDFFLQKQEKFIRRTIVIKVLLIPSIYLNLMVSSLKGRFHMVSRLIVTIPFIDLLYLPV